LRDGTAAVAVSLALARLRKVDADDALELIFLLVFAAVYVLPLTALVVRRSSLALCSTLSIAAAFSVPILMAAIGEGEWATHAGAAIGLVWTVPGSVLLWRSCGYRLAQPQR
jgi:hypothetical protein